MQSLFFSVTTATSIGYGKPTPETSTGRVAAVLYILFGLPLCLVTIADLAKFCTQGLTWLYLHFTRVGIPTYLHTVGVRGTFLFTYMLRDLLFRLISFGLEGGKIEREIKGKKKSEVSTRQSQQMVEDPAATTAEKRRTMEKVRSTAKLMEPEEVIQSHGGDGDACPAAESKLSAIFRYIFFVCHFVKAGVRVGVPDWSDPRQLRPPRLLRLRRRLPGLRQGLPHPHRSLQLPLRIQVASLSEAATEQGSGRTRA